MCIQSIWTTTYHTILDTVHRRPLRLVPSTSNVTPSDGRRQKINCIRDTENPILIYYHRVVLTCTRCHDDNVADYKAWFFKGLQRYLLAFSLTEHCCGYSCIGQTCSCKINISQCNTVYFVINFAIILPSMVSQCVRCAFLPMANPVTLTLALHGVMKLPVAVQVRLNTPLGSATSLEVDTTTPSASVHE